jgi:ABC-type multidrug transport system ATPase subunit
MGNGDDHDHAHDDDYDALQDQSQDTGQASRGDDDGSDEMLDIGVLHDIDEERSVRDGREFVALSPAALRLLRRSSSEVVREQPSPGVAIASPVLVLSWEAITIDLAPSRGGRRILHGVSGVAGPVAGMVPNPAIPGPATPLGRSLSSVGDLSRHRADLFAILGPSGAGKTTLLDVLAGRPSVGHKISGELRVNGKLMTSSDMRGVSGYVPQDDVLPGTSTVWEHLLFHGALRLPGDVPDAQLKAVIWQTMEDLGIDRIAHSFIGDQFTRGLSGGEKRRVSIATELLTSPGIMFLDEPTTGLDSTNAAKVVDILSGLGSIDVTVVLSIHQPRPDIFRLLDRVLVMSSTGGVVYSGPSAAAEGHFASMAYVPRKPDTVNVADYMLDTVLRSSDEDVRRMIDDFERSDAAQQTRDVLNALQARAQREAVWAGGDLGPEGDARGGGALDRRRGVTLGIKNKYRASYARQVRTLWQRMARTVRRHPFLITLHFVATGFADPKTLNPKPESLNLEP